MCNKPIWGVMELEITRLLAMTDQCHMTLRRVQAHNCLRLRRVFNVLC